MREQEDGSLCFVASTPKECTAIDVMINRHGKLGNGDQQKRWEK
jgi:hypothetical protein